MRVAKSRARIHIRLWVYTLCYIIFAELNHFVIQLDEEVEGMQSTIQTLQQELQQAKRDIAHYKGTIADHEMKLLQYERHHHDGEYSTVIATSSNARSSYYSEDDEDAKRDDVSVGSPNNSDRNAQVSANDDTVDVEENYEYHCDGIRSSEGSHCAPGTPTNDENNRSEYEGDAMDYEDDDEEHLYDEEEVLTEVESEVVDVVKVRDFEDDENSSTSVDENNPNKVATERTSSFSAVGREINNDTGDQYDDNRTSKINSPTNKGEMDYHNNSDGAHATLGYNQDTKHGHDRQQHTTHCKNPQLMNGNTRNSLVPVESGDESDADQVLVNCGAYNHGQGDSDTNQVRTSTNVKINECLSENGIEEGTTMKSTQQTIME